MQPALLRGFAAVDRLARTGPAHARCGALRNVIVRHDLRRTAVVFHGELGLADHRIAAITGHQLDTVKKILETYMPRTTAMAARAISLSHARDAKTLAQRTAV